jgi:uncharacterized membrane protein YhhN
VTIVKDGNHDRMVWMIGRRLQTRGERRATTGAGVRAALVGYVGLAVVDAVLAERGAVRWRRATKPLLMPLLAAHIALTGRSGGGDEAASDRSSTARGPVLVGLLAGGLGDTALLGRSHGAFATGLGSFLVGHLSYAVALARAGGWAGVRARPWIALPAAGLVGAVATTLAPRAGSLRWPVVGYAGVIGAMATLATGTRRPATAAGAWLFCVSDLVLAWQRVGPRPLPHSDAVVMATYTAGQALIARGLVES